ncbi:rhodanese-like domain-containing protein [Haloterrigena sp. SYSU A558-1]|uniref:Rhodanese-like domain-containing protein n=1 Tax=Haloterrigena gelatinilytica TaxID=2741724 RepID=A0A8J8GKN1_9EURY|nr:rhodanese-like domain-containing protein [Haloterrigena gelatinilytica]NUB90067.1 rhodanese-like domain-containing protein [Haloterrigena gelatinilytica]NUC74108.1 rhodanese-like domain-containing protein [Haloterrigena gelatinilytica]
MNRRTFLAVSGATTVGVVAGCLGNNSDATAANEFDYELYSTPSGVDVPLAPVDDVYEWYKNDEARFADARGRTQYDEARIKGAVFSPAEDAGSVDDDPVEEWSKDTRIVTYCQCPHHLSSQRAASLIDAGYEHAYAIDEGLRGWINGGYPLEGSAVDAEWQKYEINGTTDSEYAGEMVTLEQLEEDRSEIAPIQDDGSYTLQLYFAGSTDSQFRVKAPDYTVEETLEELTNGTVSG